MRSSRAEERRKFRRRRSNEDEDRPFHRQQYRKDCRVEVEVSFHTSQVKSVKTIDDDNGDRSVRFAAADAVGASATSPHRCC